MHPVVEPSNAQGLDEQPKGLGDRLMRFVSGRIRNKIIAPYMVLVFVLGVLLSYVVMTLVSSSIFDKFREDLVSGAKAVNSAMVKVEDEQLAVLRSMAFTNGVDAAITADDGRTLQDLLGPLQVNSRTGYVDVFDSTGRQVLALRPEDKQNRATELVDPGAARWAPVQSVLRGETDALGDKYTAIVQTSWGEDIVYSVGPVKAGDQTVGVLAVGNPLSQVVSRLAQESVTGVTVYTPDGQVRTTSVKGMGSQFALVPEVVNRAAGGTTIETRSLEIGSDRLVELVAPLKVRGENAATMGVSKSINVIQDTGQRTLLLMIGLFSIVIVLVLGIGFWLARSLTRPIVVLVDATERVRAGNLDHDVPVMSRDETGVLAREFNSMVVGLRERNKSRDALGRYFSKDFYDLVQAGSLELGGEKREITVVMSDIRSFTTISERMDPAELLQFLNEYFSLQVAAIKKHGGEIDKYMGDAILAKFGAPIWYPDHAERAAMALLDMREALAEFNRRRESRGEAPIRIGIGANTGHAVVGNIGSESRMEYTIIGDTVNATQRIEDLCKELRWDLLISDTLYERVRHLVEVGEPTPVVLRGREQETLVYPLLSHKKPAATDEDQEQAAAPGRQAEVTAAHTPAEAAPPVPVAAATATVSTRDGTAAIASAS